MKYNLINSQTKEEFLCEKVVINGFDYYVNDDEINQNDFYICASSMHHKKCVKRDKNKHSEWVEDYLGNQDQLKFCKKIIATNNPNIDIPKVVDEVDAIHDSIFENNNTEWKKGYNHSQSTHPNSDEDMELFIEFVEANYYPVYLGASQPETVNYWLERNTGNSKEYSRKELLQLWKDRRVKTIYFN